MAGVAGFSVGVLAGGLATGVLMMSVGATVALFPPSFRLALFGGIVVFLAWIEFSGKQARLPQRKRMIPPTRFHQHPLPGGFFFGVELGLGFRTYIPHVAPYALAAALVLVSPAWPTVVAVAIGWSLGRTTPLLNRLIVVGFQPVHRLGVPRSSGNLADRLARLASRPDVLLAAGVAVALLASARSDM